MQSTPPSHRSIVVIGGGIIGCTSAYYLTRHPSYSADRISITLLEASSIASGASGKAGGLVAKWAYPRELVDVTFGEHERLAREHDGAARWGWRYTGCGEWRGRGESARRDGRTTAGTSLRKKEGLNNEGGTSTGLPDDLDWVDEHLTDAYEPMAPSGDTAQVHPYLFTTSMLELAQQAGVKVLIGAATSIEYDTTSTPRAVTGVNYTDPTASHTLPATTVILSAGPWTSSLFPSVPISGTRAHSITVRPSRPVSAYALFTSIRFPSTIATPEIYARPNNEVYACSSGDRLPLPATAHAVEVDTAVCDALFEQVSAISLELRDGEVTARQACYLPNVNAGPRGCPIVGDVEGTRGLVIAAGHSCWGICNAPGTAKAVAELVMDGKITCAPLSRLSPRMFL